MMACSRRAVAALGWIACTGLPASGDTRLVPQQHPTIQAAINAAQNGDVILVAPGHYAGPGNRNLSLAGKGLTIRSTHGPGATTIDAFDPSGAPRAAFRFEHATSLVAVIDGFTITGGHQFNGGGVYITAGSPVVQNCIITGNACDCWGAGVYSQSTGTPRILNCTIVNNDSAAEGGGVFTIGSKTVFENCSINHNVASLGGGACVFGGSPSFINCELTHNTATSDAGGGYFWQAGVFNCTLANNQTGVWGDGVVAFGQSTVANSIIWNNSGLTNFAAANSVVTYNVIQGGHPGVGNVSGDPGFRAAAAGDFRLLGSSSAIDAGSNLLVPSGVAKDISGMNRFIDCALRPDTGVGGKPIVDMGAHEFCTAPWTKPRLAR